MQLANSCLSSCCVRFAQFASIQRKVTSPVVVAAAAAAGSLVCFSLVVFVSVASFANDAFARSCCCCFGTCKIRALKGTFGCVYGGKADDDHDVVVLVPSHLEKRTKKSQCLGN